MTTKPPSKPNELLSVIRNVDEQTIRQRLDELDGEAAGLKVLLRAIRARDRVCQPAKTEGRE